MRDIHRLSSVLTANRHGLPDQWPQARCRGCLRTSCVDSLPCRDILFLSNQNDYEHDHDHDHDHDDHHQQRQHRHREQYHHCRRQQLTFRWQGTNLPLSINKLAMTWQCLQSNNQLIPWNSIYSQFMSIQQGAQKILSKHLEKNMPFEIQAVYQHLPTGPHLWAEPSAWNWSNPILTPIHPATKDLPVARNAWVSLPVASCIRACHTSNSVTVGQQHGIT